jgi:hypothetical protein
VSKYCKGVVFIVFINLLACSTNEEQLDCEVFKTPKPIFSIIDASCTDSIGNVVISNYDNSTTYSFYPSGPVVSSVGIVRGYLTKTTYNVAAEKSKCISDTVTFFVRHDVIIPTFNNEVSAIFRASCATSGCHMSPNPASNIDLSTYATAKFASFNRTVLQSIKHVPSIGVTSMPPDAPKLSNELINIVECWIQNGAPE